MTFNHKNKKNVENLFKFKIVHNKNQQNMINKCMQIRYQANSLLK